MLTVDTSYAVQYENRSGEQEFPSLQVDDYKPSKISQRLSFGLSEESYNLLSPGAQALLNLEVTTADFGKGEVPFFKMPQEFRVVVLVPPPSQIMVIEKESNKIVPLLKGQKLGSAHGRVSVVRLLLAVMVGDQIVMGADGKPQIFTWKLRSYATGIVGNGAKDETGTIMSLNKALLEHNKVQGVFLVHLVSVALKATVANRKSTQSDASSYGADYGFDGGAKIIKDPQPIISLIQTEEFKELARDPFRLNGRKTTDPTTPTVPVANTSYDEIPF